MSFLVYEIYNKCVSSRISCEFQNVPHYMIVVYKIHEASKRVADVVGDTL